MVALSQVANVAEPDRLGVQANTFSGAEPLAPAHVPDSVLAPVVVPVNVPPAAGTTIGLAHAPGGRVVVVVGRVVVEVTMMVEVVGRLVEVVVGTVLVVDRLVDVVVAVMLVVVRLVEVVVTVAVVVVVAAAGGTTVSEKAPSEPPHDPLKPSTRMKYVCPAVTVGVTRDPWWLLFAEQVSPVPQPLVSSLHATCVPPPQVPLRT